MRKIMTKRKGFTLIEIIGVIIVLGVILAITVPNISNVISNSYLQTYEVDLKAIKKTAIEYILSEHVTTTPGVQTRIELSDMINAGLIDEILDPQTKEVCDGYATVSYDSGNYIVHSYLKCGNNYQSDNYNKTDFVLPVITLLGDNPINLNVGETYKDPGVKATDDVDGDITDRIVITGNINPNVAGPHTIIYNVADSAGNDAIAVTRTINVVDNLAPTITIETNGNSIYAKSGSTVVSVRDNAELNNSSLKYQWINGTAIPTESSFSTTFTNNSTLNTPASTTGDYYLWILAKDSVGNIAMTKSNVFYLDNIKPVITLTGSANITINKGNTYSDAGATSTDAHSGLNGNVTATGSVNPNVAGTYTVTYNVSDKAGNAATPVVRTIIVRDVLAPVITLNGSNPVNMDAGTTYTDAGATATDDVDGNVTSKITVTGTVNPSVGGMYKVIYTVKDNANNTATATRAVNVYVTWYRTRTVAPATYYDNYAATSTTTYSCPNGYTSSGSGSSMTCYMTSYAANISSTSYSCPGSYSCASSYYVSTPYLGLFGGNQCVYSGGSSISASQSCTCPANYSQEPDSSTCGFHCLQVRSCQTSATSSTTYSCPAGYTSSGSGSSMTCSTTSYTPNQSSTTYSCPSGGTLSGTTCLRGYYQCSSGTLSGSSCYGSWSAWSTTPATPSSTLEVNTEKRLSSV
jgi:prepilin-type N-terminal cleavage/methylation domain-containing protein